MEGMTIYDLIVEYGLWIGVALVALIAIKMVFSGGK